MTAGVVPHSISHEIPNDAVIGGDVVISGQR